MKKKGGFKIKNSNSNNNSNNSCKSCMLCKQGDNVNLVILDCGCCLHLTCFLCQLLYHRSYFEDGLECPIDKNHPLFKLKELRELKELLKKKQIEEIIREPLGMNLEEYKSVLLDNIELNFLKETKYKINGIIKVILPYHINHEGMTGDWWSTFHAIIIYIKPDDFIDFREIAIDLIFQKLIKVLPSESFIYNRYKNNNKYNEKLKQFINDGIIFKDINLYEAEDVTSLSGKDILVEGLGISERN
jgi:hypothetical protein